MHSLQLTDSLTFNSLQLTQFNSLTHSFQLTQLNSLNSTYLLTYQYALASHIAQPPADWSKKAQPPASHAFPCPHLSPFLRLGVGDSGSGHASSTAHCHSARAATGNAATCAELSRSLTHDCRLQGAYRTLTVSMISFLWQVFSFSSLVASCLLFIFISDFLAHPIK